MQAATQTQVAIQMQAEAQTQAQTKAIARTEAVARTQYSFVHLSLLRAAANSDFVLRYAQTEIRN